MKTCLHYICQGCPPIDILENILKLMNPTPLSCWSTDFNGNTCLHSLCGGDCDCDSMSMQKIFRVIVENAGKDRFSGKFCLKRAKQFLSIQNDNGCTALHFLVSNSSESGFKWSDLVKSILFLEPELGYIMDNDDETPLHYCAQEGDKYPSELYEIIVNACPDCVLLKSSTRLLPCDDLWKVIFKLTFLLANKNDTRTNQI